MEDPNKKKRTRSIVSRLKGGQPTLHALMEPATGSGPGRCDYGDIFEVIVRVTNDGNESLDSSHPFHPDFLSYHWLSDSDEEIVSDGFRTPLLGIVHPGQSQVVRLRVSASAMVEHAVLAIDMVREGICWFAELGGEVVRIPYEIGGTGEPVVEAGADAVEGAPGVGAFWGKRAEVRVGGEYLGWLDHPIVLQECVLPKLGTGETNWLLAMMALHEVPRGGKWLSLGCGEGGLELWLVEGGAAGSIEGVDVSAKAVEMANAAAAERGLDSATFRVVDLDKDDLPGEEYDVIIASMAIHHIDSLEGAFSKIHKALKPGGFFFANEYVGPDRFNFPAEQLELANSVIAVLPRELRRDIMAEMERGVTVYKDKYVWRSPEQWLIVDPSEAARSSDIIPVFRDTFEKKWVYEYGGSLLHLVLEHIAANFEEDDEIDRCLIRLLDVFETTLISSGYLNNDFAMLAGAKE